MSEEELLSESMSCELNKQCSALITLFEKIFSKEKKFTKTDFMEVYTNVYQYYFIDDQKETTIASNVYLSYSKKFKLRSGIFFEKLCEFFRNRVHGIFAVGEDEKDDGGVLRFYAREWSEYQRKAKMLDNACCRIYRQYQRFHKEKPTITIYKLAVTCWRDHQFRTRVVKAIINLIERERNGNESPDIHLIKDVLNCFIEDADDIHTDYDHDLHDSSRRYSLSVRWSFVGDLLSVYRDTFEDQFLRDTEIFYASQRTQFLNGNSSRTEYPKFVERKLQIEERVRMYLPESTGEKSVSICRAELITKYSDNGSQRERTVERGMQHLSFH